MTDEHLIPVWAPKVLDEDAREVQDRGLHISYERHLGVETSREWSNKKQAQFVAKVVCKQCNGGWMSDIEQTARPYLEPMIRGQQVTIDRAGKDALAAWMGLKLVIARYNQSPPTPVTPAVLLTLYEQKAPPSSWYVRVSTYVGTKRAEYACDLRLMTRTLSSGVQLERYRTLFTFVIGYFGWQVFAPEKAINLKLARGNVSIACWPPSSEFGSNEQTIWPTQGVMTDSSFELMCELQQNGLPR